MRVAYLGPRGTFTEQAARSYFLDNAEFLECKDIPEIFTVVSSGSAEFGVVPVENSIEGSVNIALDMLLESELQVSGEIDQRVVHNLIAQNEIALSRIRVVVSHPQALAQCRIFLKTNLPKAEVLEAGSTAAAVKSVMGSRDRAAIGSELASKIYGLKVIRRGIEDNRSNFTRFFVLSRSQSARTGNDKTSIIFSTEHAPGALYKALGVFADRGINLTKIESRPARKRPWEYIFYCDLEGHVEDRVIKDALKELRGKTTFLKILGSYPRAKGGT
ncbi:prephenate dehydratase [Candidatus Bathyarchaeota archaeon]|nr:prephenate dehydratase [Candidatus Bathyarchaeota archaeon]